MKNATRESEIQAILKIREVLEEYLSSRIATKVAVEIYEAIQEETEHSHRGEKFYVHKYEKGELMLTKVSVARINVQNILNEYLVETDKVQECLDRIMKKEEYETIVVPGSDNAIYRKLLSHKVENEFEERLKERLKEAMGASIDDFEVFVCDPSLVNGSLKLQFVPGFKPAVGYTYNELDFIAKENNLSLGKKEEYVLFVGWFISSLIKDGWSERKAWNAVCINSTELGHYRTSEKTEDKLEVTGSRKVAGKCDLGNTYKILARDKEADCFFFAGGAFTDRGTSFPISSVLASRRYYDSLQNAVGWFVRRKGTSC